MKYILKNPDETTNDTKPYYVRFNEELYKPLANLREFDHLADKPIYISNYQKDFLATTCRVFWIVCYYDISVIKYILENMDGLTHYAFCTHDRDTNPDATQKKIHTHLLLFFNERVSGSYIAFWFHSLEIKAISRIDISNEWNYLIHDSKQCRKERKHLYNASERFSDDAGFWLARCIAKSDNDYYVEFFKDFVEHRISIVAFIRKYGREAITQMRNLELAAKYYSADKLKKVVDNDGVIVGEIDNNVDDEF